MQRFAILGICFLQIAVCVLANGHYSVIGPGTIHSEHKYTVAVAVHDTTEPSQLKIGITGPSYNDSKIVDLNTPDEVKLVEFVAPVLEEGEYNLTAEGLSGIKFFNTTKLNMEFFEPHVLIQTDKGAYKPGDVVNFRVIFLDENLKPSKVRESVTVFFEDSKRNRIKEIKNLDVVRGVYTGKFQISEFPVLGTWRITVKTTPDTPAAAGGRRSFFAHYRNSKTVYFDVKKYVLPKYVVKVEATERLSVLDGDFHAVVRANYTFGKPVNGKTTLIIETYSYGEGKEKEIPRLIKTADMVNGKSKFDLNLKDYQHQIHKKHAAYLTITATVEEEFTGVKINDTTNASLYPYRYMMFCKNWDTCTSYHADKEEEVVYEIQHVDGSMVQDTKSVVRLIYTETITETWQRQQKSGDKEPAPKPTNDAPLVFESHMNASGIAVFKVKLPELEKLEDFNHFFKVELEYAEQKDEVNSAYQYRPPKEEETRSDFKEPTDYFKVEVEREKDRWSVDLNKEATVLVNSSEPIKYFVYTIVGRGNILKVERVVLPEPAKVHKFKFQPTLLMAPNAQIYVHYVEDGELHYSEHHFNVEYEFQNKINITVPEQVKVGEEVPLKISTTPNSFVGLLAVDQSVLLLKEYNDVSEGGLNWQLGTYSTRTPDQGGYSTYPGDSSGLVTLTNANYFYNYTKPWYLNSGNAQPLSAVGLKTQVFHSTTVAGFGAAEAAPASPGVMQDNVASSAPSAPAVRKDFQETWIFDNIESTEAENFTWSKKIPDTITSWVITGFSLNPEKGFAATKDKTYMKTFQPFFVQIRLPYSVKRGEVISVPALVFNYLDKDLDVDVTLENSDNEFDFTEASNEVLPVQSRTKTVRVPSNSAKGVSFMIRPKVIGKNLLKFVATSPLAGDAIHKPLKVEPEGLTQYANRAYFVNLKDTPETKEKFELDLPEDIVPDSEHAEFSVVGDLLGPLLNNLDYLVRLPTGCGEQTMSKFVPNLLVLRYLKSINNLTPTLESRIKQNLERGYQNMLSFRHTDGSFSSFGPGETWEHVPRNGSTWLTAYVTRFLQLAEDYIKIDAKVVEGGLAYLNQRQAANGSFTEAGEFFYRSQNNGISLTASVLLAYLAKPTEKYTSQIDAGFKFIVDNLEKAEDLRTRALAVYTLKQGKHEDASKQLASLKAQAKTDDDRMWWTSNGNPNQDIIPYYRWWRFPHSEEVETTSYVMLSLLDNEDETTESILPIVKWLVAQRNNYGGFASTQDTIFGLQALIKFVEKSGYEPAIMDIEFDTQGKGRTKHEVLDVTKENGLLLQTFELPAQTHSLDFGAKGKGAALVQISYQYNIYEKEQKPSFALTTVINDDTPAHKLEFDACVEYVGADGESNMAIMEVALPSGYVADTDNYDELRKVERVRLVESKNSDTKIVVYFESLRKNDTKCLTIGAFKSFDVALQKPAPIVVYDYYDNSKKASTFYEVASKLCDICDKEEEDCQKACGL